MLNNISKVLAITYGRFCLFLWRDLTNISRSKSLEWNNWNPIQYIYRKNVFYFNVFYQKIFHLLLLMTIRMLYDKRSGAYIQKAHYQSCYIIFVLHIMNDKDRMTH